MSAAGSSSSEQTIQVRTDPLWYKDAVIYQVHIKSYRDSNADGYGDLKGLTERLDYIETLGANCIWLLPFYPSPLRDDGYDIPSYQSINPPYGTREASQTFPQPPPTPPHPPLPTPPLP